jgi:hypothetical protein
MVSSDGLSHIRYLIIPAVWTTHGEKSECEKISRSDAGGYRGIESEPFNRKEWERVKASKKLYSSGK